MRAHTHTRTHAHVHVLQAQRELGLHLTPIELTLADMARTLIQLGIAKPAPAAAP